MKNEKEMLFYYGHYLAFYKYCKDNGYKIYQYGMGINKDGEKIRLTRDNLYIIGNRKS